MIEAASSEAAANPSRNVPASTPRAAHFPMRPFIRFVSFRGHHPLSGGKASWGAR